MPYAPVSDGQLYYEVSGSGPAVLFVHGMYGNHVAWFQQTLFFSRQFSAITVDLRGFGLSRNVRTPAPVQDDLRAVLDHAEIDDVALIGQSMGGNACLAFAQAETERARCIVFAGSLGGVSLPVPVQETYAKQTTEASALPLINRMFSRSFVENEPERAELFQQIIGFNDPLPLPRVEDRPTVTTLADLAARIPVQFVVGEEDLVQPAEVVTKVARSVSGSQLEVIPGAGHSAYFEKPSIFNQAVMDFLMQPLVAPLPGKGDSHRR